MVVAVMPNNKPSLGTDARHPLIIIRLMGEVFLMELNVGRQTNVPKGLRDSFPNVPIEEQDGTIAARGLGRCRRCHSADRRQL